jgi:hypothetical protein
MLFQVSDGWRVDWKSNSAKFQCDVSVAYALSWDTLKFLDQQLHLDSETIIERIDSNADVISYNFAYISLALNLFTKSRSSIITDLVSTPMLTQLKSRLKLLPRSLTRC